MSNKEIQRNFLKARKVKGRRIKSRNLNKNSVSLAGEFAVLSQLALRGYDANMTIGRTKSVDILVSDPETGDMFKVEVKTNYMSSQSAGGSSKLFGKYISAWPMNEKHEHIKEPNLFYCFVNINKEGQSFRYFIVPSKVVAQYVKRQHKLWLDEKETHSRSNKMRTFRIGLKEEKYPIPTPTVEEYENNWDFLPAR
ncbi:MAG: hypothetical protein KBB01_05760 [Candidatus Omnitrophica bacterium]|jgi:hypothetical protein|nr:hypothetical protein [Candidatus Omnitrophota bacterium]